MTETQLGFDGREVSIPESMSFWHPRETQKLVLRLARRPIGVTPLQAGTALHAARRSSGMGSCGIRRNIYGETVFYGGKGCCCEASSDGSASLKRLQARGLVEQRKPRGPYFAVLND